MNDITGATPITEEDARKLFLFNCKRVKDEYRGQQLVTLISGNYQDLLYKKDHNRWGYLTSRKI